jgi:hypothetical protein
MLTLGVARACVNWYQLASSDAQFSFQTVGIAYMTVYQEYERGRAQVDFMYVINILDQALISLILVCSFYYYKVLSLRARMACIFITMTYALANMLQSGKQKYLGDVIIFMTFTFMVNVAVKGERLRTRSILRVGFIVLLSMMLLIEALRQRYAAAGIDLANIYIKANPLINWDHDSLLLSLVGEDYGFALSNFLSYFSSGLYGLYLSLTLPFEWTYFVGNSYSLGRIVEIIIGQDGIILNSTYPYRVGEIYGWDMSKWHSLFSWMASDITFIGVLFVTPLFSYFYARTWIAAIRCNRPFAGPLFIFLSLGVIFSFANNQLMHSLAGIFVLTVLLLAWRYFGYGQRTLIRRMT